ncbi:hypothetical protein LJK87_19090 [Paenibacillus sp. P25]|nr:hypothetical protein LJK87_19090 [Paenibacillus sp. P25]
MFTQLTFILGIEGTLSGEDLEAAGDGRYFLKSGKSHYTVGDEGLEISFGAYEHLVPAMREDQHPAGCQYVHVNLVTPFERTFTVRSAVEGKGRDDDLFSRAGKCEIPLRRRRCRDPEGACRPVRRREPAGGLRLPDVLCLGHIAE